MVVDFHSHILPRIDDGSQSVEESIAMLRLSAQQGIRQVILTPHFNPQMTTPQRFLERRDHSLERLQERLDPELPRLHTGAEVYFYPQMSHSDDLEKLAIGGTRCILVEMPLHPWTNQMYRELEEIYKNLGLIPVIAHINRYVGRFRDYGIPKRLSDLPVLVQANASFFLEGGKGMNMLRSHQVHFLGSDCHNMTNRKPNLGPALERIIKTLGKDAVKWVRSNERRFLR